MQEKELLAYAPITKKNPVMDWIDRELLNTYALNYDQDKKTNALLEIRHLFLNFHEGNIHYTLSSFYRLLPRLEEHYYVVGYRIRHWLSLNFQIVASDPLEQQTPIIRNICQTMRSLEMQRKVFFELFDYSVPFHDIRVRFHPIQ